MDKGARNSRRIGNFREIGFRHWQNETIFPWYFYIGILHWQEANSRVGAAQRKLGFILT